MQQRHQQTEQTAPTIGGTAENDTGAGPVALVRELQREEQPRVAGHRSAGRPDARADRPKRRSARPPCARARRGGDGYDAVRSTVPRT